MVVTAILVLAVGSVALAQEMMIIGSITKIDAMANTMTVAAEDGKEIVFTVDEKCRVYCHVGKADKNLEILVLVTR